MKLAALKKKLQRRGMRRESSLFTALLIMSSLLLMVLIQSCAKGGDPIDVTPKDGGSKSSTEDPVETDQTDQGVSGEQGTDPLTESYCGDGVVDPTMGESCDQNDLADATCETLGYTAGQLFCDTATCTYNTSMCQVQDDTTTSGASGSYGGG